MLLLILVRITSLNVKRCCVILDVMKPFFLNIVNLNFNTISYAIKLFVILYKFAMYIIFYKSYLTALNEYRIDGLIMKENIKYIYCELIHWLVPVGAN